MAERRSLTDAMDMTPEKLAFIQGNGGKTANAKPTATAPAEEKIIEIERSAMADDSTKEGRPRISRPTGRRRTSQGRLSQAVPEAGEILDQVLVSFTTSLTHGTVQALRRFCLEQRLRHGKPDTQQEIVEEALREWLARQAA